jgi:creatinine amidohydrolase
VEHVRLEYMSWMDCRESLHETDLVIVPIGSVEQHGPHLPLGTDWLNIEYAAVEAAKRCTVVVAPTIKTGISDNHMDFPGTITLRPETLVALIEDYCTSLSVHGFRRFVLLNGHGGNNSAINVAVIKLRRQLAGHIFGHVIAGLLKKRADGCLEDKLKYHADEGETSRMLVTAPELVRMDRASEEIPRSASGLFAFGPDDSAVHNSFFGLPRTKACTSSGIFGNPLLATPEKGKKVHEAIVQGLCEVIQAMRGVDLSLYNE